MEKNKPKYILVHCTDCSYKTIPDQFNACNGWHKDRDFPKSSGGLYIGYHRLITGEKNYLCREDDEVGAHCNQKQDGVSMNFQSLGVCVGFDGDIEYPTTMQYALLQKQIWDWQDKYGIPDSHVRFHRYYSTDKTCPGSLIDNKWLADILKRLNTAIVLPDKPAATMCIAQEKVIADQKVELTGLRKWFQWFVERYS